MLQNDIYASVAGDKVEAGGLKLINGVAHVLDHVAIDLHTASF